MFRTTLGLVDTSDRVVVIFVGPPAGDVTWHSVHEGVRVALADAKRRMRFTQRRDRRGTFKTVAAGLSYGGGQRVRESLILLIATSNNNKMISGQAF